MVPTGHNVVQNQRRRHNTSTVNSSKGKTPKANKVGKAKGRTISMSSGKMRL
jgi:hypothetical protein